MALPTVTKTWIIAPNNRIRYTTRVATMGAYLFGIKEFLKTNGYVVIGSSNGVTATPSGALTLLNDGVDRWVTSANASIRGTVAASAQSWIVLRDGNGVDILLTYQGSGVSPTGDNLARISFSPGQLFIAAATATHQPTATDECVVSTGVDMIDTATTDRIWHGWVSDDQRHCRFAVTVNGNFIGRTWGIEALAPAVVAPAVFTPPVWGFSLISASDNLANGTAVGIARVSVSAVNYNCTLHLGAEFFANHPSNHLAYVPELQSSGVLMLPLSCASATASARGKLGDLVDQWIGGTAVLDGITYGARQFIAVSGYTAAGNGGIWPWDGVTAPMMF